MLKVEDLRRIIGEEADRCYGDGGHRWEGFGCQRCGISMRALEVLKRNLVERLTPHLIAPQDPPGAAAHTDKRVEEIQQAIDKAKKIGREGYKEELRAVRGLLATEVRDGRESCPVESRCGRCLGCCLRERGYVLWAVLTQGEISWVPEPHPAVRAAYEDWLRRNPKPEKPWAEQMVDMYQAEKAARVKEVYTGTEFKGPPEVYEDKPAVFPEEGRTHNKLFARKEDVPPMYSPWIDENGEHDLQCLLYKVSEVHGNFIAHYSTHLPGGMNWWSHSTVPKNVLVFSESDPWAAVKQKLQESENFQRRILEQQKKCLDILTELMKNRSSPGL
jgi:hypothetical protein